MCMHMHIHVEAGSQAPVSASGMPSAFFETESFLAGSSSVRRDSPRDLPVSASPTLGLHSTPSHPKFLNRFWGLNSLRSCASILPTEPSVSPRPFIFKERCRQPVGSRLGCWGSRQAKGRKFWPENRRLAFLSPKCHDKPDRDGSHITAGLGMLK